MKTTAKEHAERIQEAIDRRMAETEARRPHKEFDQVYKRNRGAAYAHFPLLLLGIQEYYEDKRKLLDTLIHYSICYNAALHLDFANADLPMTNRPPNGFNENKKTHRAVASAMARLEISGGDMNRIRHARRFCRDFLEQFGDEGHPKVRIPMGRMFEFRDREDIRELDFRVLCAVNSCIGKERFAIVRADDLALRAVGAKDRETLVRLGVLPPSERQVRFALEKLQRMGYFHRVLDNRRTFICRSGTMSLEELKATVLDWKTRVQEQRRSGKAARL